MDTSTGALAGEREQSPRTAAGELDRVRNLTANGQVKMLHAD